MTWTFINLSKGFISQPRATFDEAFTDMFHYVKRKVDANEMTFQELETSLWLEQDGEDPVYFYKAKEMAHDSGIMLKLLNQTSS